MEIEVNISKPVTLGLTVAAVIVLIGVGIVSVAGMSFYPLIYNSYQTVYSQLPANATGVQTAVNTSFQNSITYVQQASSYAAVAVNTLASVFLYFISPTIVSILK